MENGCVGNHSDCCLRDPFPEYYVLVVDVRLYLLFRLNVENLERAAG